jgi:hypothetical protein
MLTLLGNPISKSEDYKVKVCSLFPSIVYLDYHLLGDFRKKEVNELVMKEEKKDDSFLSTTSTREASLEEQPIPLVAGINIIFADLALEFVFANDFYKSWIASLESSVATTVFNRLSLLRDDTQAALLVDYQKYQRICTEYIQKRDAAVNLVDEDRSALVAGYEQARLSVSKPINERDNKTTFSQWVDSLTGLEKQFTLVIVMFLPYYNVSFNNLLMLVVL